ncbi:protein mab-21-like 3 [Glandiceps talaboti]
MPAVYQELNEDLNYYTESKVEISHNEMTEAVKRVHTVLKPILEYVNTYDERFSREIIHNGSYASGLKVSKPDEFDFLVSVKAVPNFHWTAAHSRYYNITSTGEICTTTTPLPNPPKDYHFVCFNDRHGIPIWQEDTKMTFDDDLIPSKVKNHFRGLVAEAIEKCNLTEQVELNHNTHGPAITLRLRTGTSISFDLVPHVLANGRGLPPSVLNNWPRSSDWPPRDKVEEVIAIGADSVPKGNLYWLTSFGRCEMALYDGMDRDGGCRKQCLKILKKLREDHWCRLTNPALTSYHLKTLLLWECERYPYPSDWSPDKLGERIMALVQQLKTWIQSRRCPHYFIESINLFEDKDGKLKDPQGQDFDFVETKLDEFMKDPRLFLRDRDTPCKANKTKLNDMHCDLNNGPSLTLRSLTLYGDGKLKDPQGQDFDFVKMKLDKFMKNPRLRDRDTPCKANETKLNSVDCDLNNGPSLTPRSLLNVLWTAFKKIF